MDGPENTGNRVEAGEASGGCDWFSGALVSDRMGPRR